MVHQEVDNQIEKIVEESKKIQEEINKGNEELKEELIDLNENLSGFFENTIDTSSVPAEPSDGSFLFEYDRVEDNEVDSAPITKASVPPIDVFSQEQYEEIPEKAEDTKEDNLVYAKGNQPPPVKALKTVVDDDF